MASKKRGTAVAAAAAEVPGPEPAPAKRARVDGEGGDEARGGGERAAALGKALGAVGPLGVSQAQRPRFRRGYA